jgi:hypothetical protein
MSYQNSALSLVWKSQIFHLFKKHKPTEGLRCLNNVRKMPIKGPYSSVKIQINALALFEFCSIDLNNSEFLDTEEAVSLSYWKGRHKAHHLCGDNSKLDRRHIITSSGGTLMKSPHLFAASRKEIYHLCCEQTGQEDKSRLCCYRVRK